VTWTAGLAVAGLGLWAWVAELVWWAGRERGALVDGFLFAAFTLFPIVLLRGVLTRVMRPGKQGWWSRFLVEGAGEEACSGWPAPAAR
jgi:hypothetical protein